MTKYCILFLDLCSARICSISHSGWLLTKTGEGFSALSSCDRCGRQLVRFQVLQVDDGVRFDMFRKNQLVYCRTDLGYNSEQSNPVVLQFL
jgi:hypothetical protein